MLQFAEVTPALGLRQFVDLGGDHVARHAVVHEPCPRTHVGVQSRMPAVHQQQGGAARGPEILRRQLVERLAGRLSAAGVAVARQIHQVERRLSFTLHAEEVRETGLAGRRAGPGQRTPQQRVDEARLANVRAPDHGQLGHPLARKTGRAGRARDELGGNLHLAENPQARC